MAKRGRPCGFDREQALRRALDVFWEAGYEGATMAALKEAMGGICAPSMYAAYGSKEALFRSAVELYLSQECQLSKGAFALPTACESIAALLLRRCTLISLGRMNNLDAQVHASSTGRCYSQQPVHAPQALRIKGSTWDFSETAGMLCQDDQAWLAGKPEPTSDAARLS